MRYQKLRFVVLAVAVFLLISGPAAAMDCPCTWEEVLCGRDAVAEVEVFLATETSKDRMEIRRMIWNGTKHPIRPPPGLPYIKYAFRTKFDLQVYLSTYVREKKASGRKGADPEWVNLLRRALRRGSYRSLVFLKYEPDLGWGAGGAAVNGIEWLEDSRHREWWKLLKPALDERIRLAAQGKKPEYCADLTQPSKFEEYNR